MLNAPIYDSVVAIERHVVCNGIFVREDPICFSGGQEMHKVSIVAAPD